MDYIKSLEIRISKYEDIGLGIHITIFQNELRLTGYWYGYMLNKIYDLDLLTKSNLNMEALIDAFKNEFEEYLMENSLRSRPIMRRTLKED